MILTIDGKTMQVIKSPELAKLTGATFRQIDYWARNGIITPVIGAMGSGTLRLWDPKDINRVACIAKMSKTFGVISTDVLKLVYDNYERGQIYIGNDFVLRWRVEDET